MSHPIPSRLAQLRQAMRHHGVDACLVPSADPHMSEYLPGHWQARAWLSGFTGSAGTLVVTLEQAGLWTDSRYFARAERELSGTGIELMRQRAGHASEHLEWLCQRLGEGQTLAVAGDSLPLATREQIERRFEPAGARLRTDLDLPGTIWTDRPPLPVAPVVEHPIRYACVPRADKLGRLRTAMRKHGASHHLVSSLDDIAWLTNLRGSDVECNPVFLAHMLVAADGPATLFVDRRKLTDRLVASLATDGVRIADYGTVTDALGELGGNDSLLLDAYRVASAVADAIPATVHRIEAPNPSTALKARKSADELDHIREAMRRDGAAMVRAFRRLEERLAAGMAQTELDMDRLLRE